jgi:hypothetical protein
VEYDLMGGAIAGVIVVVVYALGVKTRNLYSKAKRWPKNFPGRL